MNKGYVTFVLVETVEIPAYSDETDQVGLSG